MCRSIGAIGAAVIALTFSTTALQSVIANGDTRTLSFFHSHSKESLTVTFKKNGRYDEAALKQLNHLLRDWRNDAETKMDPHLFDILWEVSRETNAKAPVHIISAYRSPETNTMLRSRSRGVAKHSQHMIGKAIDFFIPDVPLADLRAIGLRLERGGVGFYPTSGSPFVHMDTGSIRHWPRMTRDQLVRVFPDGKTVHVPTDGQPLKNYELAAAELQRRGQFGERNGTRIASAQPDGNALTRIVSSFFGGNNQNAAANNDDEDDSTPAAAPAAPPARTQVASAGPITLPANSAPKMRWSVGPTAASEPSDEVTASTEPNAALAYASPNDRTFPPASTRSLAPQLAAIAFAPGADRATSNLISKALMQKHATFAHPRLEARGFAELTRAAVDNRFMSVELDQLASDRFDLDRPLVSVVGFEPEQPKTKTRRAAR